MKQKTKLKKMKLTSVDMCRRGANPDAYINLYKSAEEPIEEERISKGLAQTILDAVKSALGMGEIEKKSDEPEDADMLQEKWTYAEALYKSATSIMGDMQLTNAEKIAKMDESVNQFAEAYTLVNGAVELEKASGGEIPKEELKRLVEAEIEDEEDDSEDFDDEEEYMDEEESKEGDEKMKRIDKSLFTPEELEQYEALIAKAVVEEGEEMMPPKKKKLGMEEPGMDDPEVDKGCKMRKSAADVEIQKALDDAKAEVAEIKKTMEMQQLTNVAKKYSILGKKEDELVNTLYAMKKSSPDAYDSYIALLDESLDMVNKNGMFGEIGKSSRGISGGSAQAKIETAASEIQKSDPNLSRTEAIAKAWDQHPELVAEYEREYRK